MSRAFIGLGGNVDEPARHVRAALSELGALPRTELKRHSSLYRSAPLGPAGQPDYVNAVAELETGLEPEVLLDALQAIEAAHGRVRSVEQWGPRTLDLDLLLYDERLIRTGRLTVPHPEMSRRNFVIGPLAEIAPDVSIPGAGAVRQLLARLGTRGLERLGENVA
jgi:2-amino-4-hydroxy-6-hydroxymethyldihydropteridine diphosphokinase